MHQSHERRQICKRLIINCILSVNFHHFILSSALYVDVFSRKHSERTDKVPTVRHRFSSLCMSNAVTWSTSEIVFDRVSPVQRDCIDLAQHEVSSKLDTVSARFTSCKRVELSCSVHGPAARCNPKRY
eukprot:GHVQ01023349.1.p2 GENE.GHVQ01023349.1~~GHVQ01023349.1.p2  ORF type:complete len:128 (+),score=9.09 GHVQ01023349.1:675-1058(+)